MNNDKMEPTNGGNITKEVIVTFGEFGMNPGKNELDMQKEATNRLSSQQEYTLTIPLEEDRQQYEEQEK